MSNKLWFKTKRYGWGWTPCSWEGWVVILVVVLICVLNYYRLPVEAYSDKNTVTRFVIETWVVVATLIWICYKKGEKPRWRWGDK